MRDQKASSPVKVLAVASKGGHWDQLMLLRPTLDRFDTQYVTTERSLGERDGIDDVLLLPDANRASGWRGVTCFLRARQIVRTLRPDVVISTGAMPGLFCLVAGRQIGARTVWIDSIANSEQQSLSGALAGRFVTMWLTQWEHLAKDDGRPAYAGAVF